MQSITLLLMLYHASIGSAELSLVEALAEALASLGNLLLNLLVVLCNLVFDENVGTVALLRVAVENRESLQGVRFRVPKQ